MRSKKVALLNFLFLTLRVSLLAGGLASPAPQHPVSPLVYLPSPQTNIALPLAAFMSAGGQPLPTYAAMKRGLEACRQQKAAKLVIPPGRYVFDDPQIVQINPYVPHVGLNNLADLAIEGQGAEFVFHYPGHNGFVFGGIQRLLIRKLNVDWDITLASPGIAKKETNGQTSIRISDGYPATVKT